MMYLLFLAILYKIKGGSFISFILSAFGVDVDEDKTPDAPPVTVPPAEERDLPAALVSKDDLHVGYGTEARRPLWQSESNLGEGGKGGGTFLGEYHHQYQRVEDGNDDEEQQGNADELRTAYSRVFSVPTGILSGARAQEEPIALGSGGRGLTAPGKDGADMGARLIEKKNHWFLSAEDRQVLKRRTIMSRITPLLILSSFVSDLDLVTDWCFYRFGLNGQSLIIHRVALAFAIVGTVMWAMSSTEFAIMSRLKNMWRGNPLSHLEHVGLGWQILANVILEDLPQFVITIITSPNSVPGILNLVASGFSLVAKTLHGIMSQRSPSLSTQFSMVDQDPVVTRNLFKLRDEAKKKAKLAEKLIYLAWANRNGEGEQKVAAVFHVLQIDPTFVDGDLDYMKPDLLHNSSLCITDCGLKGHIPKELGSLPVMRSIILRDNKLSGTIPTELTNLEALMEIDLANNELSGVIPAGFGRLSSLRKLHLQRNELSGTIPPELGALESLRSLVLSKNKLTGGIPGELGKLEQLEKLDLSDNRFTGDIPDELGNLINLEVLDLGANMLTGRVPDALGELVQVKLLRVERNMLTGAGETETWLRVQLHPECRTDFLPQHEPEELHEEEEEE